MENNSSIDQEDQIRLNKTLSIRENIIDSLVKDGFPSDKDDRSFLLSNLDGVERLVINRARIKSDDKSNQTQQHTAATIAGLLTKISVFNRNLPAPDVADIELPAEFSDIILNPGETDQGTQSLNYETFIKNI